MGEWEVWINEDIVWYDIEEIWRKEYGDSGFCMGNWVCKVVEWIEKDEKE